MTFDLHHRLNESKANIIFQNVEVGAPNALDFQLSSYLGYLIANHSSEKFYVVSKDTGYKCLCDYWIKQKITVAIKSNLTNCNTQNQEKLSELQKLVENVLSDKSKASEVLKIIQSYKTKSGINNALMKKFPSEKNKESSEIYQAIKPLIADKKGKD